ncbi:hypothetical protein [Polaribacter aestuariivivens]|uniref:hypothetical protein n=1 Tax=Polaribacter aestuariivivens TaxID=2304626 RepID=UPI003F49A0B0
MNILKINIKKSLNFERLYFDKSFIENLRENGLIIANLMFFLYVTGTNFYQNIEKSKPFGWTLFFLIVVIIIISLGIISFLNSKKLEKLEGITQSENTKILKKIVNRNRWKLFEENKNLNIINISFLDTKTDYGKQIIVLYKKNDILINCTSFAFGKTPNPYSWFSNKKMVEKFKTEFIENKNALQQNI